MVGSLAAWPQRLFMEYLINQVAADIGVGDWGPRGARNHLRFPKCLNQIEKGPKMWKIGSDKHWLRPLVGGVQTRPWLQTTAIFAICTDHIGPVLHCTVLYCTVLYCTVLCWSHNVDLCSLWSAVELQPTLKLWGATQEWWYQRSAHIVSSEYLRSKTC